MGVDLVLRPNADSSVQLSRSTGSYNYANIDEATKDEGDYNYTPANASNNVYIDKYGLPDHSVLLNGKINSVTIYAYVKVNGSTLNAYLGVNDSYASAHAISSTSYTQISDAWATNPATSAAWTWANVDALVADLKLATGYTSDGKGGYTYYQLYCCQFWVVVNYSQPTVTTSAASSVEVTTATGNGNITNLNGGSNCTVRGFKWDTVSRSNPADYANSSSDSGSYSTGAYTKSITSLPSGTTVYCRAYATNPDGTGYGDEVSFLTKPAAPIGVYAATVFNSLSINWTKSTGATGYRVYRNGSDISGLLGDVATYNDTTADPPTLHAGAAAASDGTYRLYVDLIVDGCYFNNGTTYTYKVVAVNATGNSPDSSEIQGYKTGQLPAGAGIVQTWYRSAGDSDGSYSTIDPTPSFPYPPFTEWYDYMAPSGGHGRYYKALVGYGGIMGYCTTDRGYRPQITSRMPVFFRW